MKFHYQEAIILATGLEVQEFIIDNRLGFLKELKKADVTNLGIGDWGLKEQQTIRSSSKLIKGILRSIFLNPNSSLLKDLNIT